MPTPLVDPLEPVLPTAADTALAIEASRRLAPYLFAQDGLRLQVIDKDKPSEAVAVPGAALRLLVRILTEMAQGNAVKLEPIHAELTTLEAADMLHVSPGYLEKLLDEGKIPSCKCGTYRRVRFDVLMAYQKQNYQLRLKALEELSALDQELGLGY